MKVARPNTDQEAGFQVFVNGKLSEEYVLPSAASKEPNNIAECFIAVSPGDRLTVKGDFAGTMWAGTFDLVADGSFLYETRSEGRAETQAKFVKSRKVAFDKVLNCPYLPEWTSIHPPTDIFEGTLHAQKLEAGFTKQYSKWEIPVKDADKPGIGCLCIVANISEDSIAKYFSPESSIDIDGKSDYRWVIGGWRRAPAQAERELRLHQPQVVIDSGIQPDFQLIFQENDEDSNAGQKRSSKHRKHWQENRPGFKPWCKFCFHYRSKAVLEAAGCVLRSKEVQQLDPATDFKKAPDPKKKRDAEEDEEAEDDMTPPPKKHQMAKGNPSKYLGGKLDLPKSLRPLGGTLSLTGKAALKSPGADRGRKSTSVVNDSDFMRTLAKFQEEQAREEEEEKQRQLPESSDIGESDSGANFPRKRKPSSLQRKSGKAEGEGSNVVNTSYPIDRSKAPVIYTTGIDIGPSGMNMSSHITRNGSVVLGDHKSAYDLQTRGQTQSNGAANDKVRSTNSSKAFPQRTRTHSIRNINKTNNIAATHHSTTHRNMPAYDLLPGRSEIINFIGADGKSVEELIKWFMEKGPFPNQARVQEQFSMDVNDLAITDEGTGHVTLKEPPPRELRSHRRESTRRTYTPTATTTPTARKQASTHAEAFSQPAYHHDEQARLTEPFNFPEATVKDETQDDPTLLAANTLSTMHASTTEKPASFAAPSTSSRSLKRGLFDMAGHTDSQASTPSKKHTLTANDDLEQVRRDLEEQRQRQAAKREEIERIKRGKEAEKEQKKLAYEAEMARRAEKKRLKGESKAHKTEEKARKAEEKRREEEEKRREEAELAEQARLAQEEENQRRIDAVALQKQVEEMEFENEAIERERAEAEETEGDYEIPPESDDSDSDDEANEESEEELTELTMMHQACAANDDAFTRG